ncbi:GNAT family N-acetyltransferase [Streptococcus sanguinis]|uniref:GNAT family acetyltransferase n=1 Tax=Streptococcus sanguinis SK160 TaxID=888812 RepID=F0IUN7_STRSA|nr:GNAT family N-acetyltransferase [Streptococcus sanguinis]EGD38292.1 GNAT family acetyltransferase [Streptococcus sanguinis SK160]
MKVGIYSALPEKEKQVLFELVQECNKADGGYRLPYLDNNYNVDPEMPAFFLAEMDGRTIGFLSVYADEPGQAEVSLYVLPAYRRQGVANKLLAAFSKVADKYELTEIEYVAEQAFLNEQSDFARRFDYQEGEAEIWLAQPAQTFPLEEREGIEVLQGSLDLAEEIATFQSQVFETPLNVALKYAREAVSSAFSLLYILKKDHRVVASVSVDTDFGTNYFFGLAVDQDFQGQGLGSYLLLASMQDLNKLNEQEFQIVVEKQNTRALKLYKKLGFKEMTEVVYLKEK